MHVEYKPHCLNKFMTPYSIMSQSRCKDFYNDWAQLHNIYIYIYMGIQYGSKPITLYFVFVNIQLPNFSMLTRVHSYKSKLGVYLFTGCDWNCIWAHKSRLIIIECSNIYVITYVAVQHYIVLYGGGSENWGYTKSSSIEQFSIETYDFRKPPHP